MLLHQAIVEFGLVSAYLTFLTLPYIFKFFLYRILANYGTEQLTLEKNITLEVKPKASNYNSEKMTFGIDIIKNIEDVVVNVYWILRRETVLSEGKTICFHGKLYS